MNRFSFIAALVLMAASAWGWGSIHTGDFQAARNAFMVQSGCDTPSDLPAGKNHGDMATCVMGGSRTIAWEVEKARDSDRVHRLRFTWFDFAVDDPTPEGRFVPHGDRDKAETMVDAFLEAYLPGLKEELRTHFFGDTGKEFENALGLRVAVHHFHNPSLVERVIEVWPAR